MPRKAVNLEKIARELQRAKRPTSTRELADKVGCTYQQVHKAIGQLGRQVELAGKNGTGAYLYMWANGHRDAEADVIRPMRRRTAGGTHAQLGTVYRVVEVRQRADGVQVVLEDDQGNEITAQA